jgi:cytochrome o ubiquinol oxidase subunit 2
VASKFKQTGWIVVAAVVVGIVALAWKYLSTHTIAVLDPAGTIGRQELQLIEIAVGLSVIVVIPVYAMTVAIAVRYRAGNKKAKYDPDFDHSRVLESFWWGIPFAIIAILSVITWDSSHALDPYKKLAMSKTINVDVVALDWKWLFIYPDLHLASVNLLEFPTDTAMSFNITSDTVMNSFWIPQLGGQIYAMPGMSTELNLAADRPGTYAGSSANISGDGFSSMTFRAVAVSNSDFNSWVEKVRSVNRPLDQAGYSDLSKPTNGYPVTYYSSIDSSLYNSIVAKYMSPNGAVMGMSQ